MLYTLKLHNLVCQLYLNKAGRVGGNKASFLVGKNIPEN